MPSFAASFKFNRGSALIITMLIVAAISTAAFGLSRIFLADVRIAASLENSLKAYYLAEAGLEEGLLRYRIDRLDGSLHEVRSLRRNLADGNYVLSATSLTAGDQSGQINYSHAFDTIGENDAGNSDYPAGDVPQDESVEVYTPNPGQVDVHWSWRGGAPGGECGVEVTSVLSGGGFDKVLNQSVSGNGSEPVLDAAGRTAIRVKPLCRDLDWLAFGAENPIGRTLHTVDSTGTVGGVKRKLSATVNRRSGSIVGLFDFVLGSEEDLIGQGAFLPGVDIKADGSDGPLLVATGSTISLSWTTTNSPTSCTASGAWRGSKNPAGGAESQVVNRNSTYTLTCSNAIGSSSDSVIVNIQ